MITANIVKKYHSGLLKWYRKNKRDFPWRHTKDPYKVLIAEIFLQKTDAPKVLPVYKKFLKLYPNIHRLSKAKAFELNEIIQRLGLSYRSSRLISIAKSIIQESNGYVPTERNELLKLPGIGNYIASAVCCFAFSNRVPILDTNVIRVLERVFGFKSEKERKRDDLSFWEFSASLLPKRKHREYNFALLDLSALVCKLHSPCHMQCPLKKICFYYKQLQKKNPIGIDLFSGAGGLSLGFEKAGFDICYVIENEKNAAETYRRNREKKPDLIVDTRDINKIKPAEILKILGLKNGDLDIVIGGPPCQGFSSSNMRTRNLANPQNQLVFKFIEFVNALKPKWFLMENVAGLDSFENGLLRDLLLSEFREIGYQTEIIILNSVNFGVPQNRKRIFFIGNRIGNKMDFIQSLTNAKPRSVISVRDAIDDLPKLINGNNIKDLSYCKPISKLTGYQREMRKGMNGRVSNNLTTKHTNLSIKRFKHIRQGENLLALAKKRPDLVSNYKNMSNAHYWIYMRLAWDKPSVTLNNFRKNMLIHPSQNRGLSVREAARLQSFPDWYVFIGSIGFQQQQISNAVPVKLAEEIAKKIFGETQYAMG